MIYFALLFQGVLSDNDSVGDETIGNSDDGDANEEKEEGDFGGADDSDGVVEGGDEGSASKELDEEEEEVRIVGKKRKALRNKYDPEKARKRKMRQYYGEGSCFCFFSCGYSNSCLLVFLVQETVSLFPRPSCSSL